jgi:HAD superfamily phosphoserine phosphatase-like hydrolase
MPVSHQIVPSRGFLVSDFDGTMTRRDFYQLFRKRFLPSDAPDYWAEYRAGRLTHFEALRAIFASAAPGETALLAVTDEMGLDPDLATDVAALRAAGWGVRVVSAGCAWYIRHLLGRAGVELEVHANLGRIEGGRLLMELPQGSPFLSIETGVDKAAVVRASLDTGREVAFAGDGFPDLPAALLVPEPLRFARGDLAAALSSRGERYRPFERWADVARAVLGRV